METRLPRTNQTAQKFPDCVTHEINISRGLIDDVSLDSSYFCADGASDREARVICSMLSWPHGRKINLAGGNRERIHDFPKKEQFLMFF